MGPLRSKTVFEGPLYVASCVLWPAAISCAEEPSSLSGVGAGIDSTVEGAAGGEGSVLVVSKVGLPQAGPLGRNRTCR